MRWMKHALLVLATLAAILSSTAARCEDAFERARALTSEKRYAEARVVLDPVLADEPVAPRARLLDGILHTRAGNLGDAIGVFERLRRDHPDMTEPYNNLAVLYALQGRLEDARTTLLAALGRWPDAILYANLGDVYTKLAQRAYGQARELAPSGGARADRPANTAFVIPGTQGDPGGAGGPGVVVQPLAQGTGPATGLANTAKALRKAAAESLEAVRASPALDARAPGLERGSGDAPGAASIAASDPAAFCAHAGGFEDRRGVADAALWLRSYGAQVLEVRHEEHRIASNYRVYLPPLASREAAAVKVREIRDRGVRDVAVIGDGVLANGISFGVFRSADNMHERVAALGRIGYPVRSRADAMTIVKDYVIRARASGAPAALDAAWASRFPGHAIRIVDCG